MPPWPPASSPFRRWSSSNCARSPISSSRAGAPRSWRSARRARSASAAALLLIALAVPRHACGYNEAIHSLLDDRALPAELLDTPLAAATLEDADALRREIWRAAQAHPDEAVRARFLARWPTEGSFDRWAFREFLTLNPDERFTRVIGIDVLPPEAGPPTIRALLTGGAHYPDDDRRNQDRFAYDAARKLRLDPWGNPLPADPATLDMGPLRGPASQAHAHYGLPKVPFTDDPDVLKKEPRRFAYPPTAKAFAPEFAQIFTDLAICAATLGRPGGPMLGWLFLGNSHHYIEDVANQIHTLQAIYGFFYDAKLESYKEELRSIGGFLRSRPTFVSIGIQIIENHHLLDEHLFAKRVREQLAGQAGPPAVADALAAITKGDGALEQAFDARKVGPDDPFGRAITEEVIEASSHEGGEVYELIRSLAKGKLSKVDGRFGGSDDPDAFLVAHPSQAKLERFYRLQGAGFARAGSALRRHVRLYRSVIESARVDEAARQARFQASARRLLATQVVMLDARDERLARFVPRPPRKEEKNWLVPLGMLGFLLVFVGGPTWLIRRRRRKRERLAAANA